MTKLPRTMWIKSLLFCLAGPSVALATNMPPTVALTGFGMGAYSVTMCAAEASDLDGAVVKVEFYANDQKIGESSSPPYCYDWTNVAVGVYTIKAVAIDNEGATGTSTPYTIEVRHPFEAYMLTPTNGQVFVLGEPIRLTARTTNGTGAISLRYWLDRRNSGYPDLTEPPYEFVIMPYALGKYSISGVAVQEVTDRSPYAWIAPVTIYVIPARGFPVISVQPTNQIVPLERNVALSISAFAELPVRYQWRFNNVDLPNATNAQLLLTNVSRSRSGEYSVLVSTDVGALLSEISFLDVLPPTAGAIRFANRVVADGAVLVDAPFPFESLWSSNLAARLWAGPRLQMMERLEPVLAFSNSVYFDGGAWPIPTVAPGETAYVQIDIQDVSQGPYGSHAYSRILAVQTGTSGAPAALVGLTFSPGSPPPLTPDPYFSAIGLTMGTFGSELALQIGVGTGAPRLSYQWQKDGRDIPGATGVCERSGQPYGMHYCVATLLLKNLQLSDIARYRLRVDNGSTQTVSPASVIALVEPGGGRFVDTTVRNGKWRARLQGHLGQQYLIQSSTNLLDWENCSTVTNVEGTVPLQDATHPTGKMFYRALRLP